MVLGTLCALVIAFFTWSARPGWLEMRTPRAEGAYYNLLVQGFRAGQLDLKTEVPAGLAQLADPYDPSANGAYLQLDGHPLWDLSYYHGKLYLYFGVTPALVLFWPYAVLTGDYVWHKDAVVIFCSAGFLASVALLCLLWRRYFPGIGVGAVAAGTLVLGQAGFTPVVLPRAEVYEVAISCCYALTMLALLALWGACHQSCQRGRWLTLASLAYGLAIGARPPALFGSVILLVPVAQAWREGRRIWVPLLAATGPITCIGLGLMLYNALRFDNPFEFGTHYQLSSIRMPAQHFWSPHYLGFNSWLYLLAPARWGGSFPFVQDVALSPLPAGHIDPEHPFGVLTNMPLVWLALAAPLAWRGRSAAVRHLLRGFLAAVALLVVTRILTLGPFFAACVRYEWEFCPVLVLLAVVGIFGLERALASRPTWRRAARWAWGLLLAFSVAFNLLASAIYHAEYHSRLGSLLLERGQVNEGIAHYQKALALQPDDAWVHNNLGSVLGRRGRTDEAMSHFQQALRLKPEYADARNNFGAALLGKGQTDEAIRQFQEAIRLEPGHVDTHNNLGAAFLSKGQCDEAITQFQEAVRLKPDHANAHYNLAIALGSQGQLDGAIHEYQEAILLKPDQADAHYNLGAALEKKGRVDEAIRQFQEALRLKPDYAAARSSLDTAIAARTKPSPSPGAATNR